MKPVFDRRRRPKQCDFIRVLDFCCGSGVIAAALLAREPSIRVDALDADSLAVCAARVNLTSASTVLCSDCWTGLEEEDAERGRCYGEESSRKVRRALRLYLSPPSCIGPFAYRRE
jgi:hypothetical protein